jgi:hypothetical protein
MRFRKLAFAQLALLAALCFHAAAQEPSEYAKLLASVKSGNTNVDFGRLRISYMDSPEYKAAKDTSDAEKAMGNALDAKDYPKALVNAEKVLSGDFVSIDAHFVAYAASLELGDKDQAAFHLAVFRGLIDSIRNSGDGKSMATAWVVINVHEEYVLMRVLGYRLSSQSVMNKDGHNYDVMQVKNADDGSDATFYFNVDIPFKHYGV